MVTSPPPGFPDALGKRCQRTRPPALSLSPLKHFFRISFPPGSEGFANVFNKLSGQIQPNVEGGFEHWAA